LDETIGDQHRLDLAAGRVDDQGDFGYAGFHQVCELAAQRPHGGDIDILVEEQVVGFGLVYSVGRRGRRPG